MKMESFAVLCNENFKWGGYKEERDTKTLSFQTIQGDIKIWMREKEHEIQVGYGVPFILSETLMIKVSLVIQNMLKDNQTKKHVKFLNFCIQNLEQYRKFSVYQEVELIGQQIKDCIIKDETKKEYTSVLSGIGQEGKNLAKFLHNEGLVRNCHQQGCYTFIELDGPISVLETAKRLCVLGFHTKASILPENVCL